MDKRNSQ